MDKKIENIFFLKVVDFFGNVNQTCFTVTPYFFEAQRKQVMDLIAENYGKSWQGVVLYVGDPEFRRGAVWHLCTFRHYLITRDDLKNVKMISYQEEYFNGFC